MTITCIIVDDEPFATALIKDYVSKIPALNLIGAFENGLAALHFLKENKVDLIFLDVQMPELTGIQLLKVLHNKPQIILTTAYESYALQSYEYDVTDYLLKPISFERFYMATEKAIARSSSPVEPEAATIPSVEKEVREDYIFVRTENRIQKINFNEILYIEGMKDYLRIVTLTEKVMTLLSFIKLSEMLPADDFIRVHKSYVVPLRKVESIERNHLKIKDKYIPVGEVYRAAFYEILQKKKLL